MTKWIPSGLCQNFHSCYHLEESVIFKITLREPHDEDHVDGDETQEVALNHAVDHNDERSNFLEASVSGKQQIIFEEPQWNARMSPQLIES